MSWNLRTHHVNISYIQQGVSESNRIENLASEDAKLFAKLTVY